MNTNSGEHQNHPGHETRDANPRTLAYSGLGLVVIVALMFLLSRWLFFSFEKQQPLGAPPSPFEAGRTLPPEPRLQPEPVQDLQTYLDAQKEVLRGYGWVDHQTGTVRIPIERAKQLLLQRGLPGRQQLPQEDATGGVSGGGRPNASGGSK